MSVEFVENTLGLKILTPYGYEEFYGVNKIVRDNYMRLSFSNSREIKCSLDHPFMLANGLTKKAKDLTHYDLIQTKNGSCFILSSEVINTPIELFDIVNSGESHTYYTNDVLSHNCEFHGSSGTLISGKTLEQLVHITPIQSDDFFNIYEYPKENHLYIAIVDTCEGKGKDYSVVNVIDVTNFPYRQVAIYRNNTIDPITFVEPVYRICRKYNDAFCIVESNLDGITVVRALYHDLGYENILNSTTKGGENVLTYSSNRSELGLLQTPKTKRLGCSFLKSMIENQSIILQDYNTIHELASFSKKGSSYAAEKGKNDDTTITLVMFAWFVNQDFFADFSDVDVAARIRAKYNEEQEVNDIFGFYSDGIDNEYSEFENINMWG